MREYKFEDNVRVSDSKIKGFVVLEREDGTTVFAKPNMIVEDGRNYIKNLVYGQVVESAAENIKFSHITFGSGITPTKSTDSSLEKVITNGEGDFKVDIEPTKDIWSEELRNYNILNKYDPFSNDTDIFIKRVYFPYKYTTNGWVFESTSELKVVGNINRITDPLTRSDQFFLYSQDNKWVACSLGGIAFPSNPNNGDVYILKSYRVYEQIVDTTTETPSLIEWTTTEGDINNIANKKLLFTERNQKLYRKSKMLEVLPKSNAIGLRITMDVTGTSEIGEGVCELGLFLNDGTLFSRVVFDPIPLTDKFTYKLTYFIYF